MFSLSKAKKRAVFCKKCILAYFDAHISGSSAELSYYFLFSIFPFIMASSAVTFMNSEGSGMVLHLKELLPDVVSDLFSDFGQYVREQNNAAFFSSGVVLSIYAMTRYINCLKRKLREIFDEQSEHSTLSEWGLSLFYSVFMFVGICLTFALQALGSEIISAVAEHLSFIPNIFILLWPVLRFFAIGIYVFLLLFLLYKTVSFGKQMSKDAAYGALFSTIAWIIVSVLFSFYIDNISDYSAVYGSLSAFIVLMLWLFIINNIILSGALVSKLICNKSTKRTSFV